MPFSRVSDELTSEISGTGLGLYIARNLVEQHGGQMWLESESGAGTTVHFTLPSAAHNAGPVVMIAEPYAGAPAVASAIVPNMLD
jgi:signal transduction histidine kinase